MESTFCGIREFPCHVPRTTQVTELCVQVLLEKKKQAHLTDNIFITKLYPLRLMYVL